MPRLSVTSCRPKRGKRCFKLCRPHTGSCERQRLHCEPVLGSDNKQLGLFPFFYAVESLFHLSASDARGVRGELFGRRFGGFSFYRPDSKSPSRSRTGILSGCLSRFGQGSRRPHRLSDSDQGNSWTASCMPNWLTAKLHTGKFDRCH
jgi:hypothetical protein